MITAIDVKNLRDRTGCGMLDHKEARTKEQDLCKLVMNSSLDRVRKEIEVCDVRCLKCHRKRTIVQLGWWQKEFLIENVV